MRVAVAVALIGATTAALAADTATSDGWTAARQALSSFTRSDTCGILDDSRSRTRVPPPLEPWPRSTTTRADATSDCVNERVALVSRSARERRRLHQRRLGPPATLVSWGRSDGNRVHDVTSGSADLTARRSGQ